MLNRPFSPAHVTTAASALTVRGLAGLSSGYRCGSSAAERREEQYAGSSAITTCRRAALISPPFTSRDQRWIAYIGHHGGSQANPLTGKQEDNGTSIVDVTDPAHPRYLAHIPGEPAKNGIAESGGAQMVRVCDGSSLPHADKSKVYMLRTFGGSQHEIWDVTDPAKPSRVTVVVGRPGGYAQELVGMRHRHRLPCLRRARLARSPHDADL